MLPSAQRGGEAPNPELEAALLDDTPRGDVHHPAAGVDLVDVLTGPEHHIDQGMAGLGRITLVPIGLTQPVTDLDGFAVGMRFDAAAADKGAVFGFGDRIDALADLAISRTPNKVGGIIGGIGVRHTRYHGGDFGVVGEMGKGVDVFFVGRAHDEPFR